MPNEPVDPATDPATKPADPANDDSKTLDIQVLNNGVKLLGEALVPGASMLLEKQISAGVVLASLGVLGGAALGSAFGPLGYVLARYGASAVSFTQSMQDPSKDGTLTKAINSLTAVTAFQARSMQAQAQAALAQAQAVRPQGPFPAAAPVTAIDFGGVLEKISKQLAEISQEMHSIATAKSSPA